MILAKPPFVQKHASSFTWQLCASHLYTSATWFWSVNLSPHHLKTLFYLYVSLSSFALSVRVCKPCNPSSVFSTNVLLCEVCDLSVTDISILKWN